MDTTVRVRPRDLDPLGLEAVDGLLDERVAQQARALTEVSPELAEVVGSVTTMLSGGKRLRAAFCLWGARGAADDATVPGSIEAAAALEMFHLAALVHDDVMDRSPTRRGTPTVHEHHAGRHREDGLDGDSTVFGDGVGVLVGDLCLTWSDDLLAAALRAGPVATSTGTRRVWEQMRTQVLAGQYLDLLAQARPTTSSADAERVLRYKSAKYTVEHPLQLGAAIAGADPVLVEGYGAFGLPVGEAFQLRDDVLGVFGDPSATGKSVHDDVREGKRTLLVALARENADDEQRRTLERHLGDPLLDDTGLLAVRRVLTATGALDRVEERISDLVSGARAVLDAMPVGPESRAALGALTDACAWRSA